MTLSLPQGAVRYAQTKTFDETSIPRPLLSDHSTKPNSWGLIVIEAGELTYTRKGQPTQVLNAATPGVILPSELHKVAAPGPVRFHLEFYHDPVIATESRDAEEVVL